MLRCHDLGVVEFRLRPVRVVTTISSRPRVSALARWQAASGEPISNLLHELIQADELDRLVMTYCDGQNDTESMAGRLVACRAGRIRTASVGPGRNRSTGSFNSGLAFTSPSPQEAGALELLDPVISAPPSLSRWFRDWSASNPIGKSPHSPVSHGTAARGPRLRTSAASRRVVFRSIDRFVDR